MNKYHNHKVECDNIIFHSKKERDRYLELKLEERAGYIENLRLQPRYELIPPFDTIIYKNGVKSIKKERKEEYVADFEYFSKKYDCIIVEDVKGFKTREYKNKSKHFRFKFPNLGFIES